MVLKHDLNDNIFIFCLAQRRKNDYKHDPLQEGFASHAIASRYDLNDVFGGLTAELFGATDAKVTNYHLHKFV